MRVLRNIGWIIDSPEPLLQKAHFFFGAALIGGKMFNQHRWLCI